MKQLLIVVFCLFSGLFPPKAPSISYLPRISHRGNGIFFAEKGALIGYEQSEAGWQPAIWQRS
jgi:hypothetical protein